MSTNARITRRRMLQGASGIALALPVLPSLLPRTAQARALDQAPRFVAIRNGHGGCWDSSFFPTVAPTETMDYAGHTIRRGDLQLAEDGATAQLSTVLRSASTDLTPELVAKMNMIQGVDSVVHVGHNRGAFLGNPNATDDAATAALTTARPTIDQVLAYSDWFYGDLSTIRERSLHVGHEISFGWSSPQSQSGEVQRLTTMNNPLEMFNLVFVEEPDETQTPRPLIVDAVLGQYRSLREGNRRLSPADRQRLDDHMERIDELQRKLEIVVDCGTAEPPQLADGVHPWGPGYYGDIDKNREFWQAFNEVVAVAFACDTSRIAVYSLGDQSSFSPFGGDWHQDIAHMANLTEAPGELPQQTLSASYQRVFEDVFLDLIRRLDVDDGSGCTFLDSSLVVWGQESGAETHDCTSMPLVTAGSAAGQLRTGQHLDYRNHDSPLVTEFGNMIAPNGETTFTGLSTNQFLGTVLQAMGLPPSEYESGSTGGYGEDAPTSNRAAFYPDSILSRMGESLPWLTV